nr:uncharacterized protein LOC129028683 isoform X1 [Pongo pygmaeus]
MRGCSAPGPTSPRTPGQHILPVPGPQQSGARPSPVTQGRRKGALHNGGAQELPRPGQTNLRLTQAGNGFNASGAKEKHPTNQGEEGSRPPHGRKLRSERQGRAGPVLRALQTSDQGRLSSPREGPVHGRSQPHHADCTRDAHKESRPPRTQLSRHRSPSAKARIQIMQTEARLPWTPEPQMPSTKAKWTHVHQIHHKDGLRDSGGSENTPTQAPTAHRPPQQPCSTSAASALVPAPWPGGRDGVSLCHPDWSAFSAHRVGAAGRRPAPVSLHPKAVTSVASSCLCDDPHEGCRVKGTAGFGLIPWGAPGERVWSWGAAQVNMLTSIFRPNEYHILQMIPIITKLVNIISVQF